MLPPRSAPLHALAFLLALAAGCAPGEAPSGSPSANGSPGQDGGAAGARAADEARSVRVATVREGGWERSLRVTGELASFEAATLAAKVSGRLAEYSVDLGDRVAAGDVVARQETRDLELLVAQAEAALEAARARLGAPPGDGDELRAEDTAIVREAHATRLGALKERDRLAQLHADGVVTQALIDDAEARFQAADSRWRAAQDEVEIRRAVLAQRRVELDIARQELADAHVRAPFDGAVVARLAGTGEYLAAGSPVLRLVRFHPARVRLEVPERGALEVRAGQLVRVVLEGGGAALEGRIGRMGPVLEPRTRTRFVEVELANEDGALLPGSFVRAEIVVEPDARALVVPAEALVRFAGIDKVVLAAEGRALERRVVVGRSDGARVEVLSGLSAGEQVVLSPGGLSTGQPVEVRP